MHGLPDGNKAAVRAPRKNSSPFTTTASVKFIAVKQETGLMFSKSPPPDRGVAAVISV